MSRGLRADSGSKSGPRQHEQLWRKGIYHATPDAQIVAKTLKIKKGDTEEWNELKPEGNRVELYRKLGQFKQESSILLVGHEPYLSSMVSEIVFGAVGGSIVLKKAGIARIGVKSLQPKVKGELRWLLPPRHLKKLAK